MGDTRLRGRTLGGKGAAMKDNGEVKIKSSAAYHSVHHIESGSLNY